MDYIYNSTTFCFLNPGILGSLFVSKWTFREWPHGLGITATQDEVWNYAQKRYTDIVSCLSLRITTLVTFFNWSSNLLKLFFPITTEYDSIFQRSPARQWDLSIRFLFIWHTLSFCYPDKDHGKKSKLNPLKIKLFLIYDYKLRSMRVIFENHCVYAFGLDMNSEYLNSLWPILEMII